jgi:HD superfamily phosphodiesterase
MKEAAPKEVENGVLAEVQKHFNYLYEQGESIYPFLPRHIKEVEKWAYFLLNTNPEADPEVVMISVWSHDFGHMFGGKDEDHAVRSESEIRRVLSGTPFPQEKIDQVAHCVRSHRRRDVEPSSLEARILAAADSASHMTDINYIVHLSEGMGEYVEGKVERDYRDISEFPELREKLTPLYLAWKEVIKVYPNLEGSTPSASL